MTARTIDRFVLGLAALLAAAHAVPARAGGSVDLQLRGNDKVSGTVRPAFDEECFTCDLPQGAVLVASLKRKIATGPAFQLALRQGGVDVPGTTFVAKPNGSIALLPFTAPSSGIYQLCVTTTDGHDGDYEISVSWKSKGQWKGAGGPVAANDTAQFDFDAPAGSTATIAVAAAPHSGFVPQLVDVTGPGAFAKSLASMPARPSVVLPRTGQYSVRFTNGGADGLWAATVKLKLKKTPKGKIDIRDGNLTGAFGDGHTVYGRAIGPDGGTLDLTATISSPLDGTAVTIPPGTLGAPTVITVSAAPSLTPGGGNHPAGPAVDFGPSGTVFDPSGADLAKQATITIPFDPAYFPSGTASLVIYVRAANGTLSQVPQPYVIVGNTVTFTTSHFSTYQAAATGPRGLSGRFLVLEFGGDEKDNFEGKFGFAIHSLDVDPSGANVFSSGDNVEWANSLVQGGSTAVLTQDNDSTPVNLQFPDDQTVVLDDPAHPGEAPTFKRGASDDVLVGVKNTLLAMRRAPSGTTTVATIAGKWHLFHFQFNAQQQGTQPSFASLSISGDTGLMNFAPDGTVTFLSIRSAEANSLFPTGTWSSKSDNAPPSGITWSVPDDFVSLSLPERGKPVHLNAVLDGDVLIGRSSNQGGGPPPDDEMSTDMFLLVRASSGAKFAALAGDYFTSGGEAETVDRMPSGQGLDFRVETLKVTIAKSGDVSLSGTRDVYSHDGQGVATSQFDQTVSEDQGHFTLKPDGSYTETGGGAGAFTRGGALFVHAEFHGHTFSMDFGTPLVLAGR